MKTFNGWQWVGIVTICAITVATPLVLMDDVCSERLRVIDRDAEANIETIARARLAWFEKRAFDRRDKAFAERVREWQRVYFWLGANAGWHGVRSDKTDAVFAVAYKAIQAGKPISEFQIEFEAAMEGATP